MAPDSLAQAPGQEETFHSPLVEALERDLQQLDSDLGRAELNLPRVRNYLHAVTQKLNASFDHQVAILSLLQLRAQAIDRLLIRLWQHCFGTEESGFALIAVGGYGRAELHPQSDIDLLLLCQKSSAITDKTQESIEQFITWLWDLGLDVGHSVRDINNCIKLAKDDVTIMTNLLESRLLFGPEQIFTELQKRMSSSRLWPSEVFFKAKYEEQQERHEKFRKTSYALEPNIKKSPGTLRDIQLIGWVAERHYNVNQLSDLVAIDFLTDHEYQMMNRCQEFLWSVRFALHSISGRSEDRLLFDYQKPIAEKLGYENSEHQSDVEHLMQDYYSVVKTVRELNDMLLQHFSEIILVRKRDLKVVKIDDSFQRVGTRIEISRPDVFRKDPGKLLELFRHLAEIPELEGIRAPTLRQIFIDRNEIDLVAFQSDKANQELFLSILRHPNCMRAITYMKRYGVLRAYLPAYARIVGQMQYDLFHIYTVDEHTLFVMHNAADFAKQESQQEFPLCYEIFRQIDQRELLLLAALFHDIGKGRGGDHSEIGAVEAREFCQRHGLSERETNLVSWLVKDHLVMSMTAQRKDITDPDVIHQFASRVQSVENLNYLYLLTVADICATNHSLWNNWKDQLLAELYRQTHMALLRGLENPQKTQDAINAVKASVLMELKNRGYFTDMVMELWADFKPDYFFRNPAKRISWQTRKLLKYGTDGLVVEVYRDRHTLATEIFVYMPKHRHYFTQITSLIHKKNLSIQDASLHSTEAGNIMASFVVLEYDGTGIKDPRRVQSIKHLLAKKLKQPAPGDLGNAPRQHHRYQHFDVPTKIQFSRSENRRRTLVELTTLDRPGLLAQIGMAFEHCQLELHSAKVVTLGEKVEDVFAVTNSDDSLLNETEEAQLQQVLMQYLDR